MKKIKSLMKKIKNIITNNKEIAVIVGITIISLFPLYYPGFIYTHDGIIHLFRTAGAYENIVNGDLFNRIYYNGINGLGYGWGIFYPPLSAIIPAIFMRIGFSLFTAEKLFIIFASVLAGIFAYKLFLEIYRNKFIAMIVAIMYILSPYKINQILIRGAMGEVLIFTFLPLVFLGLIKILKGEGNKKYYFIIGMIGIVYSHVISIVYTVIFGIIFLALNIKKVWNKKVILELLISSVIIILVSLPVLVPMLEHQVSKIYAISSIETDVADRVVHLGQLVGSSFEGKEVENTSYYSNEKEMNYMVGLSFIVILSLAPFTYKNIKENNEHKQLFIFIILSVITVFMMICPYIWNKCEMLDVIQYPWRLLLYLVLFISIIVGYILKYIIKNENKYSIFLIIISYSLLFTFMIGSNVRFAKTLNKDFDFNNQEISEEGDYGEISFSCGYAHEYFPKILTTEKIIEKQKNINIISGNVEILQQEVKNNKMNISLNNHIEKTSIELPLIYYKGYSININNHEKVEYQMSENGFIVVELKDIGENNISIHYTGTIVYKTIDFVAILVSITYIGYIIYAKFKKNSK